MRTTGGRKTYLSSSGFPEISSAERNDVLFATYKSMMTVPTWTVDTSPRYATIPALMRVHALSVLLKL